MATLSMVVQIADAVTAALNAAALSQPITAARYYLPEFDLKEMKDLHVSVVPAELDEEIADRGRDRAEYKIHVAVQKRVGKQNPSGLDNAAIDALMQLVQEIDDLFRHNRWLVSIALWARPRKSDLRPETPPRKQQFTSCWHFISW